MRDNGSITKIHMEWNILPFETRDGLTLYGGLIKAKKPPSSKKRTSTVVLHIHGMTDYFYEGKLVEAVARAAAATGNDFFACNNRGMGIISLINGRFFGTSHERFEDCIYDIDAAITALQKHGYKHIILTGHSTGCQKIIYWTHHIRKNGTQKNNIRKNIQALVLLSPADDYGYMKKMCGKKFDALRREVAAMMKQNRANEILSDRFKTPKFSVQRFHHLYKEDSIEGNIFCYDKPLTMLSAIMRVQPTRRQPTLPLLAVFGSDEQFTAIPPAQMLAQIKKAAPAAHTKLIPDADHSFHGKENHLYRALKNFFTTL